MATQGQRQNYQWRPNKYDSTTLTRYDQEASHWVKAFRSATRPEPSFTKALGVVGLILQLIFNITWMLLYAVASVFVWLFGSKSGGKVNMKTPPYVMPSDSKLDKMFENAETIDIYGKRT